MKATVIIAMLLVALGVAWACEPALAAGLTATRSYAGYPPELVWMTLSGVALIALAALVRRLTH